MNNMTPRPSMTAPSDDVAFRAYAAAFLAANATKRVDLGEVPAYVPREVGVDFQSRLFNAGLAGLTVPGVYGGAGLTHHHLAA